MEQLLAAFPTTMEVYLEDGQEESIDVSWECVGEDFEESEVYYFQFSPLWDETKYTVDESFDVVTDAPYISIFLYDEEMVAEAAVTPTSASSPRPRKTRLRNSITPPTAPKT